jgi:hypothetical protein
MGKDEFKMSPIEGFYSGEQEHVADLEDGAIRRLEFESSKLLKVNRLQSIKMFGEKNKSLLSNQVQIENLDEGLKTEFAIFPREKIIGVHCITSTSREIPASLKLEVENFEDESKS